MTGYRTSLRIAAVVCVMSALAPAAARPRELDVPRMELEEVLGRTVCPLKVVVDEDPLRLPRRIKFMKCDREPSGQCADGAGAGGGGGPVEPACCHRRGRHWHRGRRDRTTQCVEVLDNVVVQYLPRADADDASNATHHVVQVPVGCSCVMLAGTRAVEDY